VLHVRGTGYVSRIATCATAAQAGKALAAFIAGCPLD
jgi:pyruvate-formate lyase-activating enzyme